MTKKRDLKVLARGRAAKLGTSYTTALAAIMAKQNASGVSEDELVSLRGFGNLVPKQFAEWAEQARLKARLELKAENIVSETRAWEILEAAETRAQAHREQAMRELEDSFAPVSALDKPPC